ncbi:MAG: hypothetical protein ACFFKA_00670 [Candidatus Thorarchaeota archaeon]
MNILDTLAPDLIQDFNSCAQSQLDEQTKFFNSIFPELTPTPDYDFFAHFDNIIEKAIGTPINATKAIKPNPHVDPDLLKRDISYFYRPKKRYGKYVASVETYVESFVTGKQFGIYLANKQLRKNALLVAPSKGILFFLLTREHVELIKNKHKRQVGIDLINWKQDFIQSYREIFEPTLIEANIPVSASSINRICHDIFAGKRYDSDNIRYILSNKRDYIITDIIITPIRLCDPNNISFNYKFKLDITNLENSNSLLVHEGINIVIIGKDVKTQVNKKLCVFHILPKLNNINSIFSNASNRINPGFTSWYYRGDVVNKFDYTKLDLALNSNEAEILALHDSGVVFKNKLLIDTLKRQSQFWFRQQKLLKEIELKHLDKIMANGHF